MKDLLNWQILRNACPFLPEDHIFFAEECASTNAAAKEWIGAGNTGTALFVAAAQTAGRGRMGRAFYSPSGSGVYFTLAQTGASGFNPVGLTCAAAVAVRRAISEICGLQCDIKWVNDLLYQGKKVCGILAEAVTLGKQTALVLGVGINLRPAEFPPELSGIAGSLQDENTPRVALIAGIAQRLSDFLSDPAPEQWLDDYRLHSCVLGRRVTFSRGGVLTEATALEIAADGGLVVQTDNGTEVLRTGEITLRLS